MNRPVHFEIHAEDLERAKKFYADVFGWEYQQMGPEMANFIAVMTGKEDSKDQDGKPVPGINGGLIKRQGPRPADDGPISAFVCTMDVADIDETDKKILSSGGKVALPKMAIPGMAWIAYYKDTEGNCFGIYQEDKAAK